MTIRSSVTGLCKPKRPFPKLMVNEDGRFIAMFTSPRCGTLVYCSENPQKVGTYSENRRPECWFDYEGQVVLTNDR